MISEYKGLKIIYKDTKTTDNAIFHRGSNTIFIYDNFLKKSNIEQFGILEHEYGHYLYNKFSKEDIDFWIAIANKRKVFISDYAKEMDKFPKGIQEEFCECLRVIEIARLKGITLKFHDYRDVKLEVAYFLKNQYDNTGTI